MDITSCNSRNFAGVIKLRNLGERERGDYPGFYLGGPRIMTRGPFKSRRTSRDVIPRRLNQPFLAVIVEEEAHELRNARGL